MPQLLAKLEKIQHEAPKEMGAAMYQEALVLQKVAQKRCPVAPGGIRGVRPGELRASIIVTKPEYADNGEVSVKIVAGGPSIGYALAVHEHLSEHSPPSWQDKGPDQIHWNAAGTGPKFIEGPVLEARPTWLARLAARIDMNRMAGR
jgi:hypothetical protein